MVRSGRSGLDVMTYLQDDYHRVEIEMFIKLVGIRVKKRE
jgi:hypothetical protein